MAQACPGRCAGAAVVAADGEQIGFGLDDTGGDGSDAGTACQLDADRGVGVGILQVKINSAKSSMEYTSW